MPNLTTDTIREAACALISSARENLDRAQKMASSYKVQESDMALWLSATSSDLTALIELQKYAVELEAQAKAEAAPQQ